VANFFSEVPGSDSYLELPRMLGNPIKFLTERYAAHGNVWKTRWMVNILFLVGPEANKLVHITRRTSFSYRLGYGETAFGRVFDGSLLLQDGEEHQRDRDILQPAMGRLALQGTLDGVTRIWEKAVNALRDGESVDVYPFVRNATFEVSANALLNLGLEAELEEYKPLFQALVDGTMANLRTRFPFGR